MLKITPICIEYPNAINLEKPYAILLVNCGTGFLRKDTIKIDVLPGRIFLLKDDLSVKLESGMLVGHLIEFQEVMLQTFLLQSSMHVNKGLYDPNVILPYVDLKLDALPFLFNLIAQLNYEIEESSSALGFMHYLFSFMRHVNKDVERVFMMNRNRENDLLKLLKLIEEQYKKSKKPEDYSARMGITPRALNELCYEYFGKRFLKVLSERILNQADLLLFQNKLSIKEIAFELKFYDANHFNSVYKEEKGILPREYRKRMTG